MLSGAGFARNVRWNVLGSIGGKLIGPLFQVLIARLLLPGDFGVFAIAMAWWAAFDVLKDWGLGQATQVRGAGQAGVRVQVAVQAVTAALFAAVTVAVAPVAAELFGMPALKSVLWIVAMAAPMAAVADPLVTECLISHEFDRLAVRETVMPVASGIVGLLLARAGYGVHALAIGMLAGIAAGTLSLVAGRRTAFALSFNRSLARDLMQIGWHLVLQRLFGFLVSQADSFIVGRALGPQALGLYRMGNVLAFLLPMATVPQVQQVVFADLSSRRDPEHVRARYEWFTRSAGISLLAYSIVAYVAAPLVIPALLGEQWSDAVPLMQIFCVGVVTGFTTPMNNDLAKILGFLDSYTAFAALRAAVTVAAVAWAAQYSVACVVVTWVIVGFASNLANEIMFHLKQDIVPVMRSKVILIVLTWAWAALAIAYANTTFVVR